MYYEAMFIERLVSSSTLFTLWLSTMLAVLVCPLDDVIFARLACHFNDIIFCLHQE
jgi:hypothetical protein